MLSTLFLGLLIGLQHALDADHLAAVASLTTGRRSVRDAALAPEAKLLAIVDAHFHPDICSRKKLTVWFGFYGEAGYRAYYRQIMTEIDEERWETSTAICRQIIADGKYPGVEAEDVASTLEGLYDGFCLNILIYPGEFTHEDARKQIRDYLARTFPRHFSADAPTVSEV